MPTNEHPYECTAKGHAGESRTFFAAPPEWFANKGISQPKNCPACRNWCKAQIDELNACKCGRKIKIPAKFKISQHKKVGPYIPVTECRKCREGNPPDAASGKPPTREERREREEKDLPEGFHGLRMGIAPEPRYIIADPSYYDKPVNNVKTGQQETRAAHLLHHVPGSAHDWTTDAAAQQYGLKKPASPSTFASGLDLDDLLESTGNALLETSDRSVREYRDLSPQSKRLYRVTFRGDHDGLELTIVDQTNDGLVLATTYDNVTLAHVIGQSWYKGS